MTQVERYWLWLWHHIIKMFAHVKDTVVCHVFCLAIYFALSWPRDTVSLDLSQLPHCGWSYIFSTFNDNRLPNTYTTFLKKIISGSRACVPEIITHSYPWWQLWRLFFMTTAAMTHQSTHMIIFTLVLQQQQEAITMSTHSERCQHYLSCTCKC